MAKPDRRRDRRAEARALLAVRPPSAPELNQAGRLARFPPVHAWISSWDDPKNLVFACLTRRRDDGDLALLTLLIDLGCLGVKDQHLLAKLSSGDAHERVGRSPIPVARAEPGVVAAVVRAAADWSAECGFEASLAQRVANAFVQGIEPAPVQVPVGVDGKPFFMPGPYDDAAALLERLSARFGPDGFHFFAPTD